MKTLAHKYFEIATCAKKEKEDKEKKIWEDKMKKEWEEKLSFSRKIFEGYFIPKIESASKEGLFETNVSIYNRIGANKQSIIHVIQEHGFVFDSSTDNVNCVRYYISWSNYGSLKEKNVSIRSSF